MNQKAPTGQQMPSADLVNFRFDKLEEKVDAMVAGFATKEEIDDVKSDIRAMKASVKWWATFIVASSGALGTTIYTLLVWVGHK